MAAAIVDWLVSRRGSNPRPPQECDALSSLASRHAFYIYQDRGSCRCQTLPKILGYSLMTYSEPRSICFVLFNIRIPAAHSAFILSHPSLGLTLLPICVSLLWVNSWPLQIRNLPRFFWLYLRVEYRLFPLRRLWGLFRCRFGLMVRTGLPHFFHKLFFWMCLGYPSRQWSQQMILPTYRVCLRTTLGVLWKKQGSNLRPSQYEGRSQQVSALPTELFPRMFVFCVHRIESVNSSHWIQKVNALNLFLYGF